ncbi:VIT1/CCC1 transporter family protein [Patescibacteria group bacterium]|nr:VIT1/CCC1 transporter family protein [Patescibacteria group bacterium]MBU1703608.1 VIT1/CCC1 transporter family protein [Patescibacteria group bacterium]MBU1953561.1 VIT1/CCC1 transporter family protein [Patescibacteria group bacterium]
MNNILFEHTEHHKGNRLSDVILGGQDGLVNTLGVILGVAAASQETRIVLAAGLAATFAESVSMAAVAYTSKMAERDYFKSELEREKREIKEIPEMEVEEIRDIYRKKGFHGKLLEQIVKVITSNEKIWLQTMMRDELNLEPVVNKRVYKSTFYVGISALSGSLVPLMPFIFLPISLGIYLSIILSAMALFIVGAIKARITVGNWGKSGIELMLIGIVSALIGYGVGLIFKV